MIFAQAARSFGPNQISFMLLAYLPMLIGLLVVIIVLIMIWRAVKAHESIAESLREIARKNK